MKNHTNIIKETARYVLFENFFNNNFVISTISQYRIFDKLDDAFEYIKQNKLDELGLNLRLYVNSYKGKGNFYTWRGISWNGRGVLYNVNRKTMRELKFRAWIKNTKKMIEIVGIHPNMAMDISIEDEYYKTNENGRWIVTSKLGYEIMQFTGLKDKNGQEIYEGDILDHSDGYCGVRYDEKSSSYEVVFKDECTLSLFEACDFGRSKLCVVGNIYENQELQ